MQHFRHRRELEMTEKSIGKAFRELLRRAASEAPRAVPALTGIADAIGGSIQGVAMLAGAVGAVLVASGAIIRFLPGTSADLRQTATRMIEGGVILLAIVGSGALILGGSAISPSATSRISRSTRSIFGEAPQPHVIYPVWERAGGMLPRKYR